MATFTNKIRRMDPTRLGALFLKESIQVVRDPSSILIAFVLPFILLVIFGFGISLDVDNLRTGLVVESPSPLTESLAGAFRGSRFLNVEVGRDRREMIEAMTLGKLRGLIVIPQSFAADLKEGKQASIQTIADGSQPNLAKFVHNYARLTLEGWMAQQAAERGEKPLTPISVVPRFWFNAPLESRYFLIPGSIAVVMTIIGTLLTALVIAREWERGTMEALMATPVGIFELLAGKLVPYFALGMAAMALCVTLAVTMFGVPLRGSVVALVAVSSVFLIPALGQGLLISTIAKNQYIASQAALLSGFLPAFLLSGFIFEIPSMPAVIQWITYVVPARYLVSSLQTIFLAGDIWPLLLPNMGALAAIGALFFGLTMLKTRKRLD